MITKVDQIGTPPTPADPPSVFEERASRVWADLFKAVPQMNQQALEIDAIGEAADAAKRSAQADSDAALGYRNGANAAKAAAQGYAGSAAQSSADADVAREAAVDAAGDAGSAAARAEEAAAAAESVVVNAVQQTSETGAALAPEGTDAQRPAVGSIPAGKLVIRGSTQDAADYKTEFWDRVAAVWKVLADRTWVGQQIAAAVTSVKSWVTAQIDAAVGSTIIYPNGGSAAAPANVAINSRYVMPNPFPGSRVMCLAELQIGGVWGAAGFIYAAQGGLGVAAYPHGDPGADNIIVTTGSAGLCSTGVNSGSPHVLGANVTTPTLCRVKVIEVKA